MNILLTVLIVVFIVLSVLFIQARLNVKRYKLGPGERDAIFRLEDTPTISLCIPARNETHALEDCLSSAIASDYPKLEIIVLDDCSQDRTSQIIKGFAHDGVRFVKGKVPSEGWLGKNNAYDILAQEARGDYLVFMSVDTRLEPKSLSMLIGYMQVNKLAMISVLPRRTDTWRTSVLMAPLRYFWQTVLPLGVNIPTATSLWAVRGESLASLGGFGAFKDKINLENMLAKQFFSDGKYRFLIASTIFKVWYAKKWQSQVDTAIRLWYPALNKSFLYSVFIIAAHLLLFVVPVLVLIVSLATGSFVLSIISLGCLALSLALFYSYLSRVQAGSQPFFGMLLLPIIAIQEVILIAASYYQYKRGRVDWKGRNICYPVLRWVDKTNG